ncbi:MAG: DUF1572 family protein [Ignavibacteriales bacterium]|nr:DUF1572 family protein [Ignavibacteriales bacterium]
METNNEFGKAYIEWCRFRLMQQYWPRVERCVAELTEEEVWWRQHETNNSVGNLILHLTGNLRQFILSGVGGVKDTRNKDMEFSERHGIPKEELILGLKQALLAADETLARLDAARLLESTTVQNRDRRIFEVIAVVVDHFALHCGQIIYITKLKTGKDLKF